MSEQDWWDLLEAIQKRKPGDVLQDWHALLVFADWAEENGLDDLAGVLRFMHDNRRLPSRMTSMAGDVLPACWWPNDGGMDAKNIDTLPLDLCNALRPTADRPSKGRFYNNVCEAVLDLAKALQKGSEP